LNEQIQDTFLFGTHRKSIGGAKPKSKYAQTQSPLPPAKTNFDTERNPHQQRPAHWLITEK